MSSHGARAGLGRWHVDRSRLAARARGPCTVVEAGAGYGKTSLAREVAASEGATLVEVALTPADTAPLPAARRLAAAVRSSGLDTASRLADIASEDAGDIAAAASSALAASGSGQVLVLLDDVHHLGDDAAAVLAAALARLAAPARLLVCGRRVPQPLLELSGGEVHLTAEDLALHPDEVAEVLRRGWDVELDAPTGAALAHACGGWAGAVVLAAPRLAAVDAYDAPAAAARAGAIANLLADLVGALDDADLHALAQVARLPLLGPALDRPLGRAELFERSRAAGLPYHPADAGPWWTLPDVVREHLVAYGPADAALAARVAAEYVRRDLAEAAVGVLLDAAEPAAAADLLADLPPGRVEAIDIADLQTMVDRLPDAQLSRRPEVLVHLARACIPAVAIARRADALARAGQVAAPGSQVARAVDAEVALDDVRDGRADEAASIANRLLQECGPHETLTRARAYDILGRATAWKGETEANLRAAAEHLRTAAALADAAGVPGVAAEVLLALGYMVEYPLGRLASALEAMDAALTRVAARPRRRATIHTFRAEVLHALGRDGDAAAALAEAAELARRLGDDRLVAYAAWEAAKGAARRGEHDHTLALLDEVHAHRGPWFDHPTGMVFLADAAECCERIGERARADALLDRAEARMRELLGEDDLSVWLARAACAARSGDPEAALAALDVADRLPGLAPKDRWRPVALRAHALARRGDRSAATPLAAAAFDLAATNGTLQMPDVLEPVVAAALRQLLAHAAPLGGPTLHVQVLGGFALRRGEQAIAVPAGLPEQLVKVLAVSGGRVHQDALIDRLWPDGELAGAGQRLRNVLHRLRAADVVRREGESITLVAPFRVDLAEFDMVSTRAKGPGAAAIARQAVALYGGPLLPDDLYADWAVAPRERARRRYVDLLDLLADDAEARDDADEALQVLEQVVAADPYSEHRAVRLAATYADCGRTVDAWRTLEHAAAMLSDLGVEPSAEHLALRQALGGS